jgi:hypothetical protein
MQLGHERLVRFHGHLLRVRTRQLLAGFGGDR